MLLKRFYEYQFVYCFTDFRRKNCVDLCVLFVFSVQQFLLFSNITLKFFFSLLLLFFNIFSIRFVSFSLSTHILICRVNLSDCWCAVYYDIRNKKVIARHFWLKVKFPMIVYFIHTISYAFLNVLIYVFFYVFRVAGSYCVMQRIRFLSNNNRFTKQAQIHSHGKHHWYLKEIFFLVSVGFKCFSIHKVVIFPIAILLSSALAKTE